VQPFRELRDFRRAAVRHGQQRVDHQALGNMAPLDLLDTDFGAREVENLLRSLAYGQFV
jgi:hypothetical protein